MSYVGKAKQDREDNANLPEHLLWIKVVAAFVAVIGPIGAVSPTCWRGRFLLKISIRHQPVANA